MEGQSAQILALEAERRGDRTILALSAWLAQYAATGATSPFFVWLHLYDPTSRTTRPLRSGRRLRTARTTARSPSTMPLSRP
jgi:hypothetical protein